MKRLAVANCTRNRADLLADTLNSLAAIRVLAGCEVEMLMIDNNSSDGKPCYAIATWAMRVSVFQRAGGFDPLLSVYGEDGKFIKRLAYNGLHTRALRIRHMRLCTRTGAHFFKLDA
ncbi:glycosyltransferase family 2 protein [Roseateles sp. P5_E7]